MSVYIDKKENIYLEEILYKRENYKQASEEELLKKGLKIREEGSKVIVTISAEMSVTETESQAFYTNDLVRLCDSTNLMFITYELNRRINKIDKAKKTLRIDHKNIEDIAKWCVEKKREIGEEVIKSSKNTKQIGRIVRKEHGLYKVNLETELILLTGGKERLREEEYSKEDRRSIAKSRLIGYDMTTEGTLNVESILETLEEKDKTIVLKYPEGTRRIMNSRTLTVGREDTTIELEINESLWRSYRKIERELLLIGALVCEKEIIREVKCTYRGELELNTLNREESSPNKVLSMREGYSRYSLDVGSLKVEGKDIESYMGKTKSKIIYKHKTPGLKELVEIRKIASIESGEIEEYKKKLEKRRYDVELILPIKSKGKTYVYYNYMK